LLGVQSLDRRWRLLSSLGALASLVLISMSSYPVRMIGAAIDGAIVLDAIPFVHREVVRLLGVPVHLTHRRFGLIGRIFLGLSMGYVTILLLRGRGTRDGV
jgi:hypothetical protein